MAYSDILNSSITTEQPSDIAFYKRAVLRSAPPHFSVEILAPQKHGNAHSYGLRILPITMGDEMTFTVGDTQTVTTIQRCYEIWRRWEDCLDLQEKLETEWDRMSREKRRLLEAAKRGKKGGNSVYISSGNAASFESLPEGPDPKSVKFDVHVHLPKLSRKTSFFRVSESTVLTRGREFAALITALFDPDMPVLIGELRRASVIHDFFGWWRRDKERIQKLRKLNAAVGNTRNSTTPSGFSGSPTSPNSPHGAPRPPSKGSYPPRSPGGTLIGTFRPNSAIGTTNEFERPLPSPPQSPEYQRPRGKGPLQWPVGSATAPVSRSSSTASRTTQETQLTIKMDRPRSSNRPPSPPPSGRPVRGVNLRVSPTVANRAGRVFDAREVRQFQRSPPSSPTSSTHSSSTTLSSPPTTPTRTARKDLHLSVKDDRLRPQSQISIDTVDYDLDLSFLGPNSRQDERARHRESMISIARVDTIGTTCSEDAIIPRRRRAMRRSARFSQATITTPRSFNGSQSFPEEVGELDSLYEYDEDEEEDVFDDARSYFEEIDAFPNPPLVMESYLQSKRFSLPESVNSDDSFSREPESPMSTLTFDSSSSSGETCAVKVKFGDCVVAFRVRRDISLPMLRTRLAQKFEQARGIHLNEDFVIGFMPSNDNDPDSVPIILSPCTAARFKDRPLTTASLSSVRGMTRLLPVRSETDWQSALYGCAGKLTLHLLDFSA